MAGRRGDGPVRSVKITIPLGEAQGPTRPEFSADHFDWQAVARKPEREWADHVGNIIRELTVQTARPTGKRPSKTAWPIRSGASARGFYNDSRGTFIAVKNTEARAGGFPYPWVIERQRGIIRKLWRNVVRNRASEEAKGRMLKRINAAKRARARAAERRRR